MYDKWTIIILIIKEVWHGDSDRVGFVRSLNDHPWLLSIPRVIHVLRYDRSYYFVLLSYPWTAAPAAAAAKSLQSCLTLCDPIDSSPPGSPVPGILQARTLEWVAISFCNAWKWKVKVKSLSRVRLFVTPWTAAYRAPPSMGFSRQEYWSGVPSPSPLGLQGDHISQS